MTMTNINFPPPVLESSIVAHVVVVGFHAQLGNRIEFAYPRLRGDPVLRSPKLCDTSDISADVVSPTIVNRHTPTEMHKFSPSPNLFPHASNSTGAWGVLPDEWKFLPFMALPDGVHDTRHDVVFFILPPNVHCVSCFQQVDADEASTHSAASGFGGYESSVAARGSVQKSVVLLCRRPLYGVFADRLVPAVRAYFEQGDFARTDILASLYHSLNVSLCRPSLNDAPTLFHGLDLRSLLRKLGPQMLAVLKLIMLERRVIVYSQPVKYASNAIVTLASVFEGGLDAIAPSVDALDCATETDMLGLPLKLFGDAGTIVLQPYAPLPVLFNLIPNQLKKACLVGTSHNVGLLLSTAAVAARKVSQMKDEPPIQQTRIDCILQGQSSLEIATGSGDTGLQESKSTAIKEKRGGVAGVTKTADVMREKEKQRNGRGLPVVDALINLSTGKISVSGAIEPLCRITRAERRLMRDLLFSVSMTSASVSSSGAYVGSDDYIRMRLREYMVGFLKSVASVEGVSGGPVGWETWSAEMVNDLDFSAFGIYNEKFVKAWMQTRNAAHWARACNLKGQSFLMPPKPELDESLVNGPSLPGDTVSARLSSLQQSAAGFEKVTTFVSTKASQGLSSFVKRVMQELGKMDTAVANITNPHTPGSSHAASTQGGMDGGGSAG